MKKYAIPIILVGIIVVLAAVLTGVLIYLKNQPPQQRAFQPVTTVKPLEPDSSIWGLNYPNEYSSLLLTAGNNTPTTYGGSAKLSYLIQDPRLVILFAGYSFSQGLQPAARPPEYPDRYPRDQARHRHHACHLLFVQILG